MAIRKSEILEYQSYTLPKTFWESLHQVRNYWMKNDAFARDIYRLQSRSTPLREAFDLVDTWLKRHWED